MRQAGIIAAGALYALEHHVDRLADDHANAQILARAVEATPGFSLESGPVETNLVWIAVDPAFGTAPEVVGQLREVGSSFRPSARRCFVLAPTWTCHEKRSRWPPRRSGTSGSAGL